MFKKKMLSFMMFFILVFGMAYFPYLPMGLFKIPYDSFNITMKTIYMFLCDVGYIVILFLIYKNKIIEDFKKYFKNFWQNFEYSFKYYFIGVLIMIVSNLIIALLFKDATAGNEEAVRNMKS